MKPLRAGLLGCGGIAPRHAQAIGQLKDQVELVALCSRTEAKARAFAEQYTAGRAAVYSDYRTLLDRARLDLLVVCLPPFAHADEVELAAERGIHLLVEKPIALTSEKAWPMVQAAERFGIKTQVGFMYRFGAAVQRLKTSVEPQAIGLFSARYFCNSLHAPWWRAREKSGGQVLEQIIHLFDLMRYWLGEPVTVYSRQSNFFHRDVPDYTVEDVSATVFNFANGALGVIGATNGAIPNRWIKEWRVVTPNLVARVESIASDQDVFLLQIQDLLDAIRTGGETRTPLRQGAQSLELALAAVRSAEKQTEVKLDHESGPVGWPVRH
jgi:predicted dehydrogenase